MTKMYLKTSTAVLSFCFFILAMFSSCSRQQNYTNAIPANATEVVSVNLQTLALKAGLQDTENQTAIKKLTEALKAGLSMDLQKSIESVIENPDYSGIDYAAPVYFFNVHQSALQGMVAKVNDRSKLENFLKSTRQDEIFFDLQQTEEYSYTYNEQLFIAFNKTTLLAFSTPSSMDIGQMHNDARQMLQQTDENSVKQQKFFAKLQAMQGDICGIIASESLRDLYLKQGITQWPADFNLKNIKFLGSLNFENGRMDLQGSIYTEDETLKALIEKQTQCTHPNQGKYLPYFPQSTLMLLTMGIDGDKLCETLQTDPSVQNQITPEQMALLQSVLGAFRNDVTIGITGMFASGNLSFMAYAETNDETILQTLYGQMNAQNLGRYMRLNRLDNGDYQLQAGSQTVYFGIRGKDLFVTNDNLQYNRISQKMEPSLLDTDFANELKGQNAVLIINTEAVFDLPLVKMVTGFLSPEYRTYVNMAEDIAYLGFQNKQESGQLFLVLKDKETNALKQLVNFIKTFIGI